MDGRDGLICICNADVKSDDVENRVNTQSSQNDTTEEREIRAQDSRKRKQYIECK